MKFLSGLFLSAIISSVTVSTTSAQDVESFLELMRSDLKTEKKAVITLAMGFTDKEAEAFWPIYKEYEYELDKIGDKRMTLIKDYAANYKTMTDEKAKSLTDQVFKLQGERLELRKQYVDKVAKATSPIVAAKFAQVDYQVHLIIDLQIASEMPLISKPKATPAAADSTKPAGGKN
jgi:hypothetical protein